MLYTIRDTSRAERVGMMRVQTNDRVDVKGSPEGLPKNTVLGRSRNVVLSAYEVKLLCPTITNFRVKA